MYLFRSQISTVHVISAQCGFITPLGIPVVQSTVCTHPALFFINYFRCPMRDSSIGTTSYYINDIGTDIIQPIPIHKSKSPLQISTLLIKSKYPLLLFSHEEFQWACRSLPSNIKEADDLITF